MGVPPTQLKPRSRKAALIGEYKRSLRGLSSRWKNRQRNQYEAIVGFAKQRVYGRLAVVVVAKGYKRGVTERARAFQMLARRGVVPLLVVLDS